MRCKVGDLAIRVAGANARSIIPNGAIVRIVGWDSRECFYDNHPYRTNNGFWRVEYRESCFAPCGAELGLPDEWLRPIRDNPGADETLQWAPVPRVAEVV